MRDTPGAVGDWKDFFLEENRRFPLCKEDGGAYFRCEATPPLKAGLPHVDIPIAPLPDQVPFSIDPVVFKPVGGSSGLSDAQRAAFAKTLKRREQREIAEGGLAAL